ncbi:MAG: hypothetical protein Q8R25_04635 [bacterium]|nr:hypothetical protein [bacterium]
MLLKRELEQLYLQERLSVSIIAHRLRCSQGKINYWLSEYKIQKRTISDALYHKWNPAGDPFSARKPKTIEDAILYGLGIGLYWGEGTKSNKVSVRLGNSDPRLIKKFMKFLISLYQIDEKKLRFGLQIFADMNAKATLNFWTHSLKVSHKQFYKIIVTPYRGVGNYRQKTKYGVLTVYFNNRKLRDIICHAIEEESMR